MQINSLPSEVLAHIFELGTASPENDFGQDNFPALVSLVCKSWYTLATETPTLWNNLTLDATELPPFTKTRTQIARSKGTPLNIYLDFSSRADPELVQSIMHVLLAELARWRHLIMVVPDFDVMYSAVGMIADVFKRPRTSAPFLQVLRLYGPPEFDPTQPEPRSLPLPIPLFGVEDEDEEFEATPRLRDVVLCGVPLDWATFVPSNLERLQLSLHSGSRRPTFSQFARLVTASPKLHTLILNASGPSLPNAHSQPPRVDLPYLTSLTLDCFDPEYVERLLARVCTPALESLALADAAGDSSRVFEMLAIGRGAHTDAVGRSVSGIAASSLSVLGSGSSASVDSVASATSSTAAFPRLTSLKISSVECSPAAFRQLVRGLPNLTSVKLDARDADPAVLCTMAEQAQEQPIDIPRHSTLDRICPHLSTITCTGVPGTVIRDFVAKRLKARVPIRTVRVCAAPEGDEPPQGHWLSAQDRAWLERHVELEFFDEDEDEEIDGGAWWSTWD
ncbi:F-box-like domain-containing protein [Ceratobasidium theobromae]|uniref:F-box-like domain-containing protein n=1 Tax=Ceratobasidium theobromae TaxID=1582974 RepID=A0A5N5QD19_9AGAM|nr:F-box-like domain-containing protein [Ceratobasidium theobromae]